MTDEPSFAQVFTKEFKRKCTELIESGFRELKASNGHNPNWDEETFTEELYLIMDRIVESKRFAYIDVDHEYHDISPATGEYLRVDFKVKRATERKNIYAYMECKLLKKDSRSIYQYRREGILRFINGKYAGRPKSDGGFMVGYVIVDGIDDVVDELTPLVNNDSELNTINHLEQIDKKDGVRLLESRHDREYDLGPLTITHVLLDFS